jgi:hypothetical protein
MTRITQVRLALFAIGILVWGYGILPGVDDPMIRWIGIGFLLTSLVLRFFQRGRRDGDQPSG